MVLIDAVQLLFAQPACSDVGWAGGVVVRVHVRFPFLVGDMVTLPDTLTGTAGFCPGASLPPGLVQMVVAVAFGKATMTVTSPFPRPEMDPVQVTVSALAVQTAFLLTWTFCANAVTETKARNAAMRSRKNLWMGMVGTFFFQIPDPPGRSPGPFPRVAPGA
ncbi:hypothetical protein UC35_19650 [Ramlibacter tataouinensis]|uniref:Uncharacterized protein n=1 Tax=Ramlibacter tataouinensis TaxID=94132 RepID=A0A127JXK2_9BURK|nr:hypothetical protein UC35_19650 [Ramlibacter tataouinensis]